MHSQHDSQHAFHSIAAFGHSLYAIRVHFKCGICFHFLQRWEYLLYDGSFQCESIRLQEVHGIGYKPLSDRYLLELWSFRWMGRRGPIRYLHRRQWRSDYAGQPRTDLHHVDSSGRLYRIDWVLQYQEINHCSLDGLDFSQLLFLWVSHDDLSDLGSQ